MRDEENRKYRNYVTRNVVICMSYYYCQNNETKEILQDVHNALLVSYVSLDVSATLV